MGYSMNDKLSHASGKQHKRHTGNAETGAYPETGYEYEQSRLVREAADVGSWAWCIKYEHMIWDDRGRELLGVVPENLTRLIEAVYPGDRDDVRDTINRILQTREKDRVRFRVLRDGEVIRLEFLVKYVREENDSDYLIGTVREIIEEKETRKDLRETRRQYELLFEGVQDAVFLIDVDREKENRCRLS